MQPDLALQGKLLEDTMVRRDRQLRPGKPLQRLRRPPPMEQRGLRSPEVPTTSHVPLRGHPCRRRWRCPHVAPPLRCSTRLLAPAEEHDWHLFPGWRMPRKNCPKCPRRVDPGRRRGTTNFGASDPSRESVCRRLRSERPVQEHSWSAMTPRACVDATGDGYRGPAGGRSLLGQEKRKPRGLRLGAFMRSGRFELPRGNLATTSK